MTLQQHTNNELVTLSVNLARLRPDHYLDVLEDQFRKHEPVVQAFLPEEDRFKRLHREAHILMNRFPDPKRRPALFGVAVGVKDIFNVDGFDTRAGSKLPASEFAGVESECVTRLKNAGALVLGKTVSAEFAYIAPGRTRNPHNDKHTPGGSSSGSAAAVGAGMCTLALGTQTVGSICRPAAYCGVAGFKPSYDRISRAGVVPVSGSLDHVGFFTPDSQSAKLAACVLIPDWSSLKPHHQPVLAVPHGPYLEKVSPEGRLNFEESCARLAAAGYKIVHLDVMPEFDDIVKHHFQIMSAQAAQVHSNWFRRYEHLYHEKTSALIRRGMSVSAQQLKIALRGMNRLRLQLNLAIEEAEADLWIAPGATGTAPAGLDSTGDSVMNLPWTQAGLPVLSLPSGINNAGLPFGVQIAGKWRKDESVLTWAPGIEKVIASE